MAISIKEVITHAELGVYIHLPDKIHANHHGWVPPMYSDEWEFYNPEKNRFFQDCSTILYLAYKDAKPVGRIMGIINHKYNKVQKEECGRFFAFECYHDAEVACALLQAVEEWLRKQGMKKIIGPFGFSDKDPEGFLIEGFDQPVVIATNYSMPYMVELTEGFGYKKEIDCLDYILPVPKVIPDFYKAIYNRTLENNHFTLKEFDSRRELKKFIRPVFELINKTYAHIYGFSELTVKEMDYFANRYISVINPKFVKVIFDEHKQLIAFALAMPEISEGIRKARGRLFPFGFYHILKASRTSRLLTMLLGAIHDSYRNNGLDVVLGIKMLQSAQEENMEFIDSHLVLETNNKMRAEYEKMGGVIKKRFRIFSKPL
jgi:hypothetical protein